MIFEIFNRDNQRMMITEDINCIPDSSDLKVILSCGNYYCKINNKKMSFNKVKDWLNTNQ